MQDSLETEEAIAEEEVSQEGIEVTLAEAEEDLEETPLHTQKQSIPWTGWHTEKQ